MTNSNENTEIEVTMNETKPAPLSIEELGDLSHFEEIIEAILFAAGHPITYKTLGDVLGLTDETAKAIVEIYSKKYNKCDGLPRGIMMLLYPDSCQLCTREEFGEYIREALGIRKGGNLSQSSIETLAIIAYNEPVTRAYVETIRGVDTTYTITSLCEKGLIAPCGRLDVPGRPLLYKTTPDFLRVFGLTSLSELPEVSALAIGKPEEGQRIIEEIGDIIPEANQNDPDALPLYSSEK